MKYETKDFISIFRDVFPEGFCEHLISEFDKAQEQGAGYFRTESEQAKKHRKDDYHIFSHGRNLGFENFQNEKVINVFFNGLQKCFELYTEQFSVLTEIKLVTREVKLQKTTSGGGYHIWHFERGNNPDNSNRSLVFMLYLNTLPVEANGETEFLYQQKRINPVANTMLIWPADFTHVHRGNPVYGDNTKYVATGWFSYD